MAASKCVHKGCGKTFTDDNEPCIYHPGPPVFHEGQKGWKCCKPRVLTFDEFMTIPPCTTGKHSTVDDTPKPPPRTSPPASPFAQQEDSSPATSAPLPRVPVATPTSTISSSATPQPPPQPEDDTDDPDAQIPPNTSCKRKSCTATSTTGPRPDTENCTHHPGAPVFHEGSKGWSCCKRRVLDFDDFLKIPGCTTRARHSFIGPKKKSDEDKEEELESVRSDFYQTGTTVIASLYLKQIDKATSSVTFTGSNTVELDLRTADKKRLRQTMELYGDVDVEKSGYKIMGTKLEFELVKAEGGLGWPALRRGEGAGGLIIQTGRAGMA